MKNNTVKKMKEAQSRQAAVIRKKTCYDRVSKEFDMEYRIAYNLQNARKRKNLTQSQLAERMGTTQSVVSRVEKGRSISLEILSRYFSACGARLEIKMA